MSIVSTEPENPLFPVRYRFARFLLRNYLSLFFCYYGALVAEEWVIWIGMAAFGIGLDQARKRWAPELSESPSALVLRLDLTKSNATLWPTLNIVKRPVASVFWMTNFYFIGVITADEIVGAEGMESYYALFKPFTNIMAQFSRLHEKLLIGLPSFGFLEEVPLTDHVYAFSHAGMAFWMILVFCFVRLEDIRVGWSNEKFFADCNKCKKNTKFVIGGILFFGLAYMAAELISPPIKCNDTSPMFDVCDGILFYYLSIIFYLYSIFVNASATYVITLFLLILCGSSERELNEHLVNGGKDENHE